MNKRCCRCKNIKNINEFYKNRSSQDGLSFECIECRKVLKRDYYQRNRENIIKKTKKWYYDNIEYAREKKREYGRKNAEAAIKKAQEWYENNKERKRIYDAEYRKRTRQKRREASKRWRLKHPGRKNADTALRRTRKLKATPQWADLEKIKQFYENCPSGYHVDHIIPLCGDDICGLHVIENLQYLPAIENISKGNTWEE